METSPVESAEKLNDSKAHLREKKDHTGVREIIYVQDPASIIMDTTKTKFSSIIEANFKKRFSMKF